MASIIDDQPAPLTLPAPVFGTMEGDDPAAIVDAVSQALAAGFRHFDMAERYTTGRAVGEALQASGVPRGEMYLISKLDGLPAGTDFASLQARVEAMLAEVGPSAGGYFDLLLIHHPAGHGADLSGDPSALATPEAWGAFEAGVGEAWGLMSRLRACGLAKEVGVSNFYQQHMDALSAAMAAQSSAAAAASSVPVPGINGTLPISPVTPVAPVFAAEVFVDAVHPEAALVASLQASGTLILAYRPLAFFPVLEMAVPELAGGSGEREGLGRGDVLRWLGGRGLSPVTSSSSATHAAENFAAAQAGLAEAALAPPQTPPPLAAPVAAALTLAVGSAEAVNMFGGFDEYAAAFRRMGIDDSEALLDGE